MRAKEFIIEYDRNKTTQMMGRNLANAFVLGGDKRQYEFYNTTFKTPEGQPDLLKIVDHVLKNLEEADPTPNKIYVPWLAREYGKQTMKRLEDAHVLTPLIAEYDKYKKRNDFPKDAKDIMRLSFSQFYTVMKNYEPPPEPIKYKGISKQVFVSDEVRIIVPEDQQAACYYGQGTTWCTAATKGTNYFDRYSGSGPLYIMLPTKPKYVGEKYQIHFPTEQFMNEEDDPINFYRLITDRFPSTIEFFKKVEPDLNDWIVFTDPRLLETIGEQIRSITMDRVWEIINDWEVEDEYYREWQLNTAKHEGIINDEMTDDEIWDKIHDDPGLNDYLDFNMEAQEFFNDVQKAVTLSPREMVDIADNIMEYESEEPLKYTNLEAVYNKSIYDYFGRNSNMNIDQYVANNIDISRDGHVRLVHRV